MAWFNKTSLTITKLPIRQAEFKGDSGGGHGGGG